MDEETAIISNNSRIEKIKNFFKDNKKLLLVITSLIVIIFVGYFLYEEYKKRKKIEISDNYNSIITGYKKNDEKTTTDLLIDLINKKDSTYSPLSLFFIIDNSLWSDKLQVNQLFDIIIDEVSMDKEIKNLIIYKKALFNADSIDENKLLTILNPIINSKSIWKSHGLYLMAEYFYSKNEKQKAKEFFNQIISLENANKDLIIEAQKRLNRDLSE